MTALVSLSRAAHLLGITRASLQTRIREGTLNSFDGQIALHELRTLFPEIDLENSGDFEKVNDIKNNAFGRRIRERALPSQEVLAQRVFAQSKELADLRRQQQHYHSLVQSILFQLTRAQDHQIDKNALIGSLRVTIEHQLSVILAAESDNALAIMQNMLKILSAQVTVRPSGHEFIADGNDTLLQAGLKAGLRLSYGCGTGSCGLCKTRVIEGEVRQIAHADYLLSEAERSSGHVLSCVCAPVSDVVIESLEARGPDDIPAQEIVAAVRTVLCPSHPDAPYQLHLQTPRSNRLRFLAGQSATLGLRTPSGDIAASFPIASCPCDDRNLHFHIGPKADESFLRALRCGWIKSGDLVNLRGPIGNFTLDPESPRPLVFLCSDTGFGPVKSLIEHALAIDHNDTFGLIWIAVEGAHYLDNHCRMWADAFDRFVYRPLNSSAPEAMQQSILDAQQVLTEARSALPFLAEADIYVAGPAEFVDVIEDAMKLPPQRSCVV